jgi:hypothetical protein
MCLKAMARKTCRRSWKRLPIGLRPGQGTFDNTRVHAVTVPTTLAQAPVDVILVARTGTAAGFRVERLNLGAMPRVREGFAAAQNRTKPNIVPVFRSRA